MAKLYSDVEVFERTEITPQGKVAKVYKVTAVTTSGTLFSVDIAQKDFSKEKVAELLAAKAQEIEEIKNL
ncbi:hypothetical protein ES708_29017 [subsurface metagenome]